MYCGDKVGQKRPGDAGTAMGVTEQYEDGRMNRRTDVKDGRTGGLTTWNSIPRCLYSQYHGRNFYFGGKRNCGKRCCLYDKEVLTQFIFKTCEYCVP